MNLHHCLRSQSATAFLAAGLLVAGSGALLTRNGEADAARLGSAREFSEAFRNAARTIGPSVVSVVAIHEPRTAPADGRFQDGDLPAPFEDPFLRRFFGSIPFEQIPMPDPYSRGQGTGVIVGEDGTIVTNNHVVAGAERFEVTLSDGRKFTGRLAGTDPETDLAVLRVDAHDLPAAQLGDSTSLEPGDWVVAVGNPFGLDHTVTVGVVSAKERSGMGVATYEELIQTDAAINPGNSGGPLVDLDGKVVGINTAIRTRSGGSDGIGFAIPSSTVQTVLPGLVAEGRVDRGWLGVSIQSLTGELARSFGRDSREGALISEVLEDTPAERAGLQAGDIVIALDGTPVKTSAEFSRRVAALEPGSKVELETIRNHERRTVKVELARRPARGEDISESEGSMQPEPARWGLKLGNVPEELARRYELEGGALVASVVPASPAELAGLAPGDVILEIDGHAIDSAEDALDALRSVEHGNGARLRVRSHGGTRFLFMEPSPQSE